MSKQKVSWGVGMCLLDGPLTLEQLKAGIEGSPFVTSFTPGPVRRLPRHQRRAERLSEDLAELMRAGWVVRKGERYALTPLGRAEVGKVAQNARSMMETTSRKLRALLQPAAASKVTLAVQAVLALIKLPAGLLSGSIGLLNDSVDTLLDLLSSLLVYLGVRYNREHLISVLLVVSMLLTGGFTMYEAAHRFFVPYVPKVDWFPFAAAVLSALAGLGMWTYQRYVGLHSSSMAFIAESVDARNHVIVSLGVTAGLVASLLRFGLLDMLVGLAVAVLILWSAVGLALDLLRASPEKPVDMSRYGFWLQGVYEQRREAYLRAWMLSLVEDGEALTRRELAALIRQAVDFREDPWLKSVGLDRQLVSDAVIEASLEELFSGGWVSDHEPLALSSKGEGYLKREFRHHRQRFAHTI